MTQVRSTTGRHGQDARSASVDRRGMVLIIVLVVILALCLGALAFSALMMGEREVTHTTGRQIQATAMAESGIEAVRQFLGEEPDVGLAESGWYDNAEQFQGILVVDDDAARGRGRFAIVAPPQDESGSTVRFGLECESAKINLNTLLAGGDDAAAARNRLMALPEMTEEIADSILDWLDEDDEPREFGAEAEYYESLDSPYRPANGPIGCLEELLCVRGVTPTLLWGADRNRNGRIDADESETATTTSTTSQSPSADSASSAPAAGWSAYLTLFSRESICQADGQPKINLNQDDAQKLYEALEEAFDSQWATFIVGYRQQEQLYSETSSGSSGSSGTNQNGQSSQGGQQNNQSNQQGNQGSQEEEKAGGGNTSGSGGGSSGDQSGATEEVVEAESATGQLDLTKPLNQKINSVLDLIGVRVKIKYKGETTKSVLVAPQFPNETDKMREYLPKLTAAVTTDDAKTADGRVNVNLAPAEVLASVPGLDATLADQIVAQRPTDPASLADYQRNPTWLLVDGLVDLEAMKTLLPLLTAGGSVYQVQSVGFFDEGGPVVRLQAVVDATESPPRVLSLRNLTPLGRGFDPAELGAQQQ